MDQPSRHKVITLQHRATLFLDWRAQRREEPQAGHETPQYCPPSAGGRPPEDSATPPSVCLKWRIATTDAARNQNQNQAQNQRQEQGSNQGQGQVMDGSIRLDSQEELFELVSRIESYHARHSIRRIVVTLHPFAPADQEYAYGCRIRLLLRSLAWRQAWIVHFHINDDGQADDAVSQINVSQTNVFWGDGTTLSPSLRQKLFTRWRIIGVSGARNLIAGAVFYQGRPILWRALASIAPDPIAPDSNAPDPIKPDTIKPDPIHRRSEDHRSEDQPHENQRHENQRSGDQKAGDQKSRDQRQIIPFAQPMVAVCLRKEDTPSQNPAPNPDLNPNPQKTQKRAYPWVGCGKALRYAAGIVLFCFTIGGGVYQKFSHDHDLLMESEKLLTIDPAFADADHWRHLAAHVERWDALQTPLYGRWLSQWLSRWLFTWQNQEQRLDEITNGVSQRLAAHILRLFHQRVENQWRRLENHLFTFDPRDEKNATAFLTDLAQRLEDIERPILAYHALARGHARWNQPDSPSAPIISPIIAHGTPRLPPSIGESKKLITALQQHSALHPLAIESHKRAIATRTAQIFSHHIARHTYRYPLLRYFDRIEKSTVALDGRVSLDNFKQMRDALRDLATFQGGYARFSVIDASADPDIHASWQSIAHSTILAEDFSHALNQRLDQMTAEYRQKLTKEDVPLLGTVIAFDADGKSWDLSPSARAGLALLDALLASPLSHVAEEDGGDRLRQLTAFRHRFDWDEALLRHVLDDYADVNILESVPDAPEKLRTLTRRIAVQSFFRRALGRVAQAVQTSTPSLQRDDHFLLDDAQRSVRIVEIFSRLFTLHDVHTSVNFAGYDILQWAALSWSYHRLEDMKNQLENSSIFVWPMEEKNKKIWQQAKLRLPVGTHGWLDSQKKDLSRWAEMAEPLVHFTRKYRPLDTGQARSFWQQLVTWHQGGQTNPASRDASRYYDTLSRFVTLGDPCLQRPQDKEEEAHPPADNFFKDRLDDLYRQFEKKCRHVRRSSPVPVIYNSLVDAFQTTLSGRYPFADTSSQKDAGMEDVQDFFGRFLQKAPTIKAFLQHQDDDSPDRQTALSFIEKMQSTHAFLAPFLASRKGADATIRVHLDIGSKRLSKQSRGAPNHVEISVGKRNFLLQKDVQFSWHRGDAIAIRLIWNKDSEFLPAPMDSIQSRVIPGTKQHAFTIGADGEWSLLRLIERYSLDHSDTSGWMIRIPVTLIERDGNDKAFPRPYDLTFSILFRLSVGGEKQGWESVSAFPSFPRNIAKISPALLR